MINTSPLYDPIAHRFKGVYRGPGRDQWDAIITTPQGKLMRKGRFTSQDEAARVVAEYYESVYGVDWPTALKKRWSHHNYYRIKRMTRYPYLANLHKGPRVTIYLAEVMHDTDKTWHRVIPSDISSDYITGWNTQLTGWVSSSSALVAIRTYMAIHGINQKPDPGRSKVSSGSRPVAPISR